MCSNGGFMRRQISLSFSRSPSRRYYPDGIRTPDEVSHCSKIPRCDNDAVCPSAGHQQTASGLFWPAQRRSSWWKIWAGKHVIFDSEDLLEHQPEFANVLKGVEHRNETSLPVQAATYLAQACFPDSKRPGTVQKETPRHRRIFDVGRWWDGWPTL